MVIIHTFTLITTAQGQRTWHTAMEQVAYGLHVYISTLITKSFSLVNPGLDKNERRHLFMINKYSKLSLNNVQSTEQVQKYCEILRDFTCLLPQLVILLVAILT